MTKKLMYCIYITLFSGFLFALSDAEISKIKSGFKERKLQILTNQIANTEPSYKSIEEEAMRYGLNRFNYALACLYLNKNIERANQAVVDAVKALREHDNNEHWFFGEAGLHWQGATLGRIFLMFGENGTIEQRLSEDTQNIVKAVFWEWAYRNDWHFTVEQIPENIWNIWESENHDLMRGTLCWMIAQILKEDPEYRKKEYDDGTTPAEKYEKWNKHFTLYMSERGRKGLFAEVAAPGYGKHSLQCVYNLYDFSESNSEVKRLAKSLLDLWWADWAAEQMDAFRGGSKLRCARGGNAFDMSPSQNAHYQSGWLYSWIYTEVGKPASLNHCVMPAATSDYIIPDVVIDIALDIVGRGRYELISRRPSANIQPRLREYYPDTWGYPLNPDWNGMVKYSYCTPSFIIGCHMSPKTHYSDWYAWGQNQWAGIMFRGSNEDFIYPEALLPNGERGFTYNQHWAIQNKNTMIIQRNKHGWRVGDMRVWFGKNLEKHEEQGWVFVEAQKAYAAAKVVFGGYTWDDDNWLRLTDKDSPIIFEAACKEYYSDYQAFKDDILDNKLIIQGEATSEKIPETGAFTMRHDVLYYEGLLNSGNFTFYFRSDKTPEINHIPVDYAPDFTFKSPFIRQAPYASEKVVITKDKRTVTLDFSIDD